VDTGCDKHGSMEGAGNKIGILTPWRHSGCGRPSERFELLWEGDSYGTDFRYPMWHRCGYQQESDEKSVSVLLRDTGISVWHAPKGKRSADMLGIIAAVLIVLWLLGFLAFHVSSGLIHVLLVIGIIMILLHLFRGRGITT